MIIGDKKWNKILLTTMIVMVIGIFIWGNTATSISSSADPALYSTWSTGWSQQIGDELYPLEDIEDFYPVEDGEPLIFVCTLPEIGEDDIFLFYSANQEVYCYIEDNLIHQFVMDDNFTLLKTPGNAWNQVDLDVSMSGETFTLILSSEFEKYNNIIPDIYFIENYEVNSLRINELWLQGLITIIVFTLIWVTYINGILWKRFHRKKYFVTLGNFYIIVFLWLVANLNIYDIFFARPILSYLLKEFFIRLIPLSLIYLAKNSTIKCDNNRTFNVLEIAALINIIAPGILVVISDISILELQWMNRVLFFIIAVVLIVIVLKKIFDYKNLDREEYPCLAMIFLLLGGVIDMVIYYINPGTYTLSGIWTSMGFIVYNIVVSIIFISLNSKYEEEKEELSKAFKKLQNTSLVEQIKAHFIFNVLNTISALCKENPKKADDAIHKFSSYLRSYLFFVNVQENISFDSELEIVEDYLCICEMRFGEQLSVVYDIQFTDFEVPPISTQTFVENAVLHGVCGRKEGGVVTVRSIRKGNYAQIIIEDTGIGFDVDAPKNPSSVGVDNVKKRIRIMSEGSVDIKSKIGEGTKVTVTIPLNI